MDNPFDKIVQHLSRIEEKIENLTNSMYSNNGPGNSDIIGGIELAIQVTGLAKATIYVLSSQNKIPHFKKNKKLYFSKTELLNWIKSGRCKTRLEIVEEFETRQIQTCHRGRHKVRVP